MPRIVGIDLGTTNSLVAFLDGDRPEIIPSAAGARMTPSIVGVDGAGRLHVGATAKNQLVAAPERTVAEVKRLMGTSERVDLGGKSYTPTEISGVILRTLKTDAERFFGEPVGEAVVTVPAYFTDAQRQATKDAGELAGLTVERIVNEPTAAALAYGLDHLDKEQHVLVYDLGGGTFDVSVLEMFSGVLEVKASAGNNRLGGGDFDRAIAKLLLERFEAEHGLDLSGDLAATTRLKAAAEQAKIELSAMETTRILLPFLAQKGGKSLSLETELTRADLERIIGPLVRSTVEPIESALADAKLDKRAITEIVLVGGSSRVPLVRRTVAELFGKEPLTGVHPDEAIALGAAVQAALKTGAISAQSGIMITDVCPFSLGVETMSKAGMQKLDGIFSAIIPRNSTIPVSRTEVYSTTSDNQKQVTIRVFQGESRLVRNNVFLDEYTVEGVPAAPAGHEKVAVTFTYDVNGILEVNTKIVSTGRQTALKIEKSPNRMSATDRNVARERLDRELAPAPGGASATPRPATNVGVGAVATPGPAARAQAVAADAPAHALLEAARRALPKATGAAAARLSSSIADLEAAIARNDGETIARLDTELTDLLFDLA